MLVADSNVTSFHGMTSPPHTRAMYTGNPCATCVKSGRPSLPTAPSADSGEATQAVMNVSIAGRGLPLYTLQYSFADIFITVGRTLLKYAFIAFPSITRGPLEGLAAAEGLAVGDLLGVGVAEGFPVELAVGAPEGLTDEDSLADGVGMSEGLPVELGIAEAEGFTDAEALGESAGREASGLIVTPALALTLEGTVAEGEVEQPDTPTVRSTANATAGTTRSFMFRCLFLAVE